MNGLFDLEQDLRQQRWRSRAPVMCKTLSMQGSIESDRRFIGVSTQ